MKFPTALNHSNVNVLLEETIYVVNWPHFSWMKLVKLSDHFVSFQLSTVPCLHKQSHSLQCFFVGEILYLGDQKKAIVTHTRGFYEKKWPKVARFQGCQISRKLFCRCQISSTWIFAWILQCWTTHSPKPWSYFYKFPNPYLKHISARGLMQWFSLVAKFCYFLKFYLGDKLGKIVCFQCEIIFFPEKNCHFQEVKKKKKTKKV